MDQQNNTNDMKLIEEIKKIKSIIDNTATEEEEKIISDYMESLERTHANQKRINLKK